MKARGIQRQLALVEPQTLTRQPETAANDFCIFAGAGHTGTETRVVLLAATGLAHQRHDTARLQGRVHLQPFLEQMFNFMWQAQQRIGGPAGAGAMASLQNGFRLAVVEHRDHGCRHDADGNAGRGQRADGVDAALGRAGARFQAARQAPVQGGHRDKNLDEPLRGHGRKEIDVAFDQGRLGDDGNRVITFRQHLQDLPGNAQAALDRLIGIGVGAHRDRSHAIARPAYFPRQQRRGVGLGEKPGFKIEAGR